MSINRIVISGRLVADPELKMTPANVAVLTISVAVDRNYKNESGEHDVDYFDVVAWRGTADFIAKYFRKGDKIEVDGKLRTRKWKDKYDQNRIAYEIQADNVDFGGKKLTNNDDTYDTSSIDVGDFKPLSDDTDVPF